jgi:hypothetical protein
VQRACRQARAALVAQRLTLKERFRRQRPRLTTCPLVPVEERTPQPRRHEEYATCSRDATTSNFVPASSSVDETDGVDSGPLKQAGGEL